MANVSIVREDEINDLYDEVMTGPFANNAQKIEQFLEGDESQDSFADQVTQLTNDINTLAGEDGYAWLEDAVAEYIALVGDFPETAEVELREGYAIWENKRAIATTMVNNKPAYVGIYSDLTDADFAKGSVCFYLSD